MKNIVVLSDGTGNGAAKYNKTNVWRLYAALDLHDDGQIAVYDDGVGARDSLWSRIMGGAFGWGLKRNVLGLYKYLCRNYQGAVDNPELADKIYLFGFSRGAFTVRVLAGLILQVGLCTGIDDEAELDKKARQNFRHYQFESFRGKWVGLLSRLLCKLLRLNMQPCGNTEVGIEFIGVWDTVDAYGFPIKELASLWHRWLYPLRFSDHKLHPRVKRACHALSVDDERHSFHPMLWDERDEPEGRIQQLWFPGVHTDVGGGYPRKSLALVSLDWMLRQVEATDSQQGLLFISDIRGQYRSQSDWNGPQHDSRAGAGLYYRYKPRDIEQLCNDSATGVCIARPKIHQSVLERIRGRSVPYAPTGIPADYEVLSSDGQPCDYETPQQSAARCMAMNHALDLIYWRQEIYFGILLMSFLLLVSRFFLPSETPGICKGSACFLDPMIQLAINVFPDFTAGWFEALRQNPKWLWGFILMFVLLLSLRHLAWKTSIRRAMRAWAAVKGKEQEQLQLPQWHPGITARLRRASQALAPGLGKLAGVLLFVLIVYLILAAANAVVFHWRYTTGGLCQNTPEAIQVTGHRSTRLDISQPCFATGMKLVKGVTYRFEVARAPLYDGDRIRADADGFDSNWLIPMVPLRRHMGQDWLRLFGRIGKRGSEAFPLGKGTFEYTARSSGELFLYVNDAVFGLLPKWDLAYHWAPGENRGQLTVTVSQQASTVRKAGDQAR
jgi:uncharacterized protein (DUF2235 family)